MPEQEDCMKMMLSKGLNIKHTTSLNSKPLKVTTL